MGKSQALLSIRAKPLEAFLAYIKIRHMKVLRNGIVTAFISEPEKPAAAEPVVLHPVSLMPPSNDEATEQPNSVEAVPDQKYDRQE